MHTLKLATALAAILMSCSAFADDRAIVPRDLSVEQNAAATIVAVHPGTLSTTISADRPDATYAIGDTVRLTLTANQDAYVAVLDVGPTGKVTQLFPNAYQADNHLRAGVPLEIAGPGGAARITVGPPTGTELIKVISSKQPLNVIPEGQLQLTGAGPFRTLEGGARVLARDLAVVGDTPPAADTFIALSNFNLYTIPGRAPAAAAAGGVTVIIPAQQPAAPAVAAHVDVPAEQPFPLLIAADKTKYRIGDKATVAVTTTQACALTVLEFNAAGVVRTLYPSAGAASQMAANSRVRHSRY